MHALRQEILPPSGVEFATSLRLTPSTRADDILPIPPNSSTRHELAARALCNVVVARSNLLRIFEIREEPAPIPTQAEDERDRKAKVRKGTEAVEGEVEMDESGEGFVNMGSVKSTSQKNSAPTVTRFYFLREHSLHGMVTGVEGIKTLASIEDKLDRLLVSFKDAKIALLEWSDAVQDLITVSIHTYERAPQLISLESSLFRALLRVDPESRCAALSLPKDAVAVLPFYQTQVELDAMEQEPSQIRDVPYSPSFILDLAKDVDENIRNVIDFVFLPGFNSPTIAVLFQIEQTWTGRLKEFKDTVKLTVFTLDVVTQNYPVIISIDGLPHDCMYLLPCGTSLGGVIILASNAIIYVDQSGRKVAIPVNGWLPRISEMSVQQLTPEDQLHNLELEGSRSIFVNDRTLFIILKNGSIYPVELVAEGKTVSKLTIGPALAQTTIPSIVKRVDEAHVFVGSTAGPSVLLRTALLEVEDTPENVPAPAAVVDASDGMDLDDDDDDIYGPSKTLELSSMNGISNGTTTAHKRSVVHLSLCDSLPAYGPIADMAFSLARNGERPVAELVAATGSGVLGGFTLFQRDLPIRTKRKLHAIGGGRGMWSIAIRQPVKVNGLSYERPVNPYQTENDSIIVSTDANPSPGLSRIASRNAKSDISITTRIPGTTIGAGPFFQRTAVLHVMTNAIRVLEPDGTERQNIKDIENNIPRPKIRACTICDPFVLIFREDDSIGLFIGETERGKIRRKDMSPMGEKSSRYLAGCFFTDTTSLFEPRTNTDANRAGSDGADKNITSTLQAAVNAGNRSQWLVLVRPQGVMEIWTLPKLSLAYSTSLIGNLQNVLDDSFDPPANSLPQDPPRKPEDLDVEQILITPLGQTSPQPHLLVFLRSGQFAIYETYRINDSADQLPAHATRHIWLPLRFIKSASKAFDIHKPEESERSILAEQKRISHHLVPFVTSPTPDVSFFGVFLTGDRPSWIVATNHGGVMIHPSGHSVVHSFTACSLWESKGDFLLYSDEGPSLIEWMPNLQLSSRIPSRSVPRERAYSNIVFEPSTSLIVAASSLQAKFASFDEEGNKLWEPDTPNISDPICDCSTLELISPDLWITMDGYEFAQNEFVNSLECVTLETISTEGGSKDFIAVGTSINRGEDLAVKGATYVFEIVEVVPDPSMAPKRWYKLKLRTRDDAKGPVTAVCGLNGYLVSSIGQKIFVRAFDLDERLVGVAFLDVGVYVTSLRTIKNLLLIGDAVKSVWFVAFQEDPYKLVTLGKDVQSICVTSADFFFGGGEMNVVTGDEEGVLRMYEYKPQSPDSKNGQYLLCETEFHGQVEYRSVVTIARRTKDEPVLPQAKLIFGHTDGSVTSLSPVDDAASKRLHLLQGQLTRNIQHVAGLNPKALRIVRNDFVSRPLSTGILDGNLLVSFESLPISRQSDVTRQIGAEREVILKDWIALSGAW